MSYHEFTPKKEPCINCVKTEYIALPNGIFLNVDVTVWRCFKLRLDELSLFEKRNEEATIQIYHFWVNVYSP